MPGIEAYGTEPAVYLFFGVFLVLGLYLWSFRKKAQAMKNFAHIASLKKIADSISTFKRTVKMILAAIVYLLLVYALMRPQGNPSNTPDQKAQTTKKEKSALSLQELNKKGKKKKVKIRENARDIIFLLDVSASMGAEDLYPNRLEKSKDYIRDIVSALDGEHIGLVIFTSVPSVQCILTLDYSYFNQVLKEVKINGNDFAGTKFRPALKEILERQFDRAEKKHKDLIILTDGGDTDLEGYSGQERKLLEEEIYSLAARAYEERGVRIHTIGLGRQAGTLIPGVEDDSGNMVKSSLQVDFLKNIAQKADGIYVPAEDSHVEMKDIFLKHIAPQKEEIVKVKEIAVNKEKLKELVQKIAEEKEEKTFYREYYIYPLAIAIVFLLIEFFISEKRKQKAGVV